MRKYYQYFGLALIMVFSFYYTDKIANIVLNKNPLMIEINKEKDNYNIKSVNAIIEGEYIIPGLNGLEVNVKESFYNMKDKNIFNKYFLVYDQVKPDISLENNKNKIIRNGNQKLAKISLILEEENEISNYLKNNNIKASLLINNNNYNKNNYFELINNDTEYFKDLENKLNLNKQNKNICVINNTNKDICLKYHNYLVKPFITLNSSNYIEVKNNIDKGRIILIKNTAKLEDVILLIKEIKYKDLQFVYLSEIIREENDYN